MALIMRNLGSHKYERTISGCWSRWHVQELRCRVSRCWYRLPHTVLTWVSWVLEVLTSSMCMAYHTSRDQYTVFLFFMRIRVRETCDVPCSFASKICRIRRGWTKRKRILWSFLSWNRAAFAYRIASWTVLLYRFAFRFFSRRRLASRKFSLERRR